MGYSKIKRTIGDRDEAMLERTPGRLSPYDQVAPGLYPDETALLLDGKHEVAVSVERKWLPNGAGIAFHAFARLIEKDGATQLTEGEDHIESAVTFHCDPVTLEQFGADAIATDLARIVIGEEPALLRDVPVDGEDPIKVPVVALSEEVLSNASIRAQIAAVAVASETTINL